MSYRLQMMARKYCFKIIDGDYDKNINIIFSAIKEAIETLEPEEVHNLCHDLEKTVPLCEFKKGCEEYQKKLYGKS